MAEPGKISVMRQKAGQGRPPPEIPHLTVPRALSHALVFAADATDGLVITPQQVDDGRMLMSSFSEDLADYPFLSVVEGPQSAFGLIAGDLELVTALIQIQTTGMLSAQPATPRPVTQTDAAMCADFFDRVLERFERDLNRAGLADAPNLTGYRFAFHVGDLRAVQLALADIPYRAFRLRFGLGEHGREGSAVVLLPFEAPVAPPSSDRKRLGREPHTPADVVMDAQADLSAILCRKRMALHQVCQLEPGQLLTIPREALGDVWLEDLSGKLLIKCRLGQAKGMRALRVGGANSGQAGADVLALGAAAAPMGDRVDVGLDLGMADMAMGVGAADGLDPLQGATDDVAPMMDMPDVDLPDVDLPDVDMPDVDLPAVDMPDMDLPAMDLSDVDLPDMDLPDDLPQVDFDAAPLVD